MLGAADDAVVTLTYHNDSAEDVYLVRWQTAFHGVEENLFDVRLDGKPVAYTGRLYKRATPQAEDYVRIPAGGSRSAISAATRFISAKSKRSAKYTE